MQKIKKFLKNNNFINDNLFDMHWRKGDIGIFLKNYGSYTIFYYKSKYSVKIYSEDKAILELCSLLSPINSLI